MRMAFASAFALPMTFGTLTSCGGGFLPLLTQTVTALPSGADAPAPGDCLKMTPLGWLDGPVFVIIPSLDCVRMASAATVVLPTTLGTCVVRTLGGGAYGNRSIGAPARTAIM